MSPLAPHVQAAVVQARAASVPNRPPAAHVQAALGAGVQAKLQVRHPAPTLHSHASWAQPKASPAPGPAPHRPPVKATPTQVGAVHAGHRPPPSAPCAPPRPATATHALNARVAQPQMYTMIDCCEKKSEYKKLEEGKEALEEKYGTTGLYKPSSANKEQGKIDPLGPDEILIVFGHGNGNSFSGMEAGDLAWHLLYVKGLRDVACKRLFLLGCGSTAIAQDLQKEIRDQSSNHPDILVRGLPGLQSWIASTGSMHVTFTKKEVREEAKVEKLLSDEYFLGERTEERVKETNQLKDQWTQANRWTFTPDDPNIWAAPTTLEGLQVTRAQEDPHKRRMRIAISNLRELGRIGRAREREKEDFGAPRTKVPERLKRAIV